MPTQMTEGKESAITITCWKSVQIRKVLVSNKKAARILFCRRPDQFILLAHFIAQENFTNLVKNSKKRKLKGKNSKKREADKPGILVFREQKF